MTSVNRGPIIAVVLFASEAIWIGSVLALCYVASNGSFPALWCAALFPLAALARLSLRGWRSTIRTAYVARAGLFAAALLVTAIIAGSTWMAIGAILVAAFILWRGWAAAVPPTFSTLGNRFVLGAIGVMTAAGIAAAANIDLPLGMTLVIGFFCLSFLALTLARGEWRTGSGALGWMAVSLGVIGLVFLAGLLVARATTPATDATVDGVQRVWGAWVDFITDRLPGPPEPGAVATPPQPPAVPSMEIEPRELSPLVQRVLTYGAAGLAIVVIGGSLIAIALASYRFFRSWWAGLGGPGAEIERLDMDQHSLWKAWAYPIMRFIWSLLIAIDRRFGPQRLGVAQYQYRLLQRWGRQHGVPREPHQTAFEYQASLAAAWPACQQPIDQITRAYVQAHYGHNQPAPSDVEQSVAAWRQLRRVPRPWQSKSARFLHIPIITRGNR